MRGWTPRIRCCSAERFSNRDELDIQILHVQRVVFDEFAARFNVFAHQRGEDCFAVSAMSSSLTESSVRRSGSMVVCQSCSARHFAQPFVALDDVVLSCLRAARTRTAREPFSSPRLRLSIFVLAACGLRGFLGCFSRSSPSASLNSSSETFFCGLCQLTSTTNGGCMYSSICLNFDDHLAVFRRRRQLPVDTCSAPWELSKRTSQRLCSSSKRRSTCLSLRLFRPAS